MLASQIGTQTPANHIVPGGGVTHDDATVDASRPSKVKQTKKAERHIAAIAQNATEQRLSKRSQYRPFLHAVQSSPRQLQGAAENVLSPRHPRSESSSGGTRLAVLLSMSITIPVERDRVGGLESSTSVIQTVVVSGERVTAPKAWGDGLSDKTEVTALPRVTAPSYRSADDSVSL